MNDALFESAAASLTNARIAFRLGCETMSTRDLEMARKFLAETETLCCKMSRDIAEQEFGMIDL
jgi:hypothetical protein